MKTLLIAAILFTLLPATAEARWKLFQPRTVKRTVTVQRSVGLTPQQFAEAEAKYMAKHNIVGHPFGVAAGCIYAGTGKGSSKYCDTCKPKKRLKLSGDYSAYSAKTKSFYRSRQWSAPK